MLFCVNVFKLLWRSLEKWRSFEVGFETWKREQSAEGGAPKWAAEQEPFKDATSPALAHLRDLDLRITRS